MATETESRYLVPDRVLFERLRCLKALPPFDLEPRGKVKITDHYMDTPGRALLRQGWACRLRTDGDAWMITLKGPKLVKGSIVQRPEFEISLPERIDDVARWPFGKVRTSVQELTGGLPLRSLVTIKQRRHRFTLKDGLRPVAELSLDLVSTSADRLRSRSHMVECELLESGTIADLVRLDKALVEHYGLVPESRSKLGRALEFVERGGSPDDDLSSRPSSVAAVGSRYGIDIGRAKYVAGLASQLFDGLLPDRPLVEARRVLLHSAALLHDIGRAGKRGPSHLVGRDILLHQPIANLSQDEQRVLATTAYLHRKKMTPERIAQAIPESWTANERRDALIIAAVVRLASALDATNTQSTVIHDVCPGDGAIRIILTGPHALASARQAQKRSDLWTMVLPTRLEWGALSDEEGEGEAVYVKTARSLGIQPWDSMTEAARKALSFHLQRMLDHEPGTRLGDDPEELHDMRVATRRMRSALRLFGPYLTDPLVSRSNDRLRLLARLLGDVRDMDVALQRAQGYLEGLPQSEQQVLDPLLKTWRSRRSRARTRLLRHLDGRYHASFLSGLAKLLDGLASPGAWVMDEDAVAHSGPRFLFVRWRVVCAYGPVLNDAPIELLHALRIDCKRLRYGLEFLRDVLPDEVVSMIPEVIDLQDHLGEMRDAAVATDMIDRFLEGRAATSRYEGVRVYRERCHAEMLRRLKTFPKAWERFSRRKMAKEFRALGSM